jgi:hypothetical protein
MRAMRVVGAMVLFVACASPSPRAITIASAEPTGGTKLVAPPDDETAWVDLETMSVNLRDKRVRTLHRVIEPAEPHLEVTRGRDGEVTVRVSNAKMTFYESIRWVGGFLWSSGDLLLATDKRLARVEFTSTDPALVGRTIWQEAPLAGSRTTALLMGPVDRSPNAVPKRVAFAAYEPDGDAPVEVAVIEALGRDSFRTTLATRRRCSRREVLLIEWRPRELAVVVACPEGADVEHVNF